VDCLVRFCVSSRRGNRSNDTRRYKNGGSKFISAPHSRRWGVLIAVGFAAARLRDATTNGEYIFTSALMLFELGLIVGLEGIAMRLRTAYQEYTPKFVAQTQANALLTEATAHHERCQQRVQQLDMAVKADID